MATNDRTTVTLRDTDYQRLIAAHESYWDGDEQAPLRLTVRRISEEYINREE